MILKKMPPVGKRKINQAFFGGEKAKKAWQEGTEEEEEEEEEEEKLRKNEERLSRHQTGLTHIIEYHITK